MAYRFKARSTTPGQYRLTAAAAALLFAEQLAADAAFLELHKGEIIIADTNIEARFGVVGEAEAGGDVVPTSVPGPMSTALEVARAQLASCPSYQIFLDVTSSSAAAAKTYLAALPAPTNDIEYTLAEWEDTLRPFGMVYTSTAGGYRATRSALYAVQENGRLFIELEIAIPTAYGTPAVDLTTDLEASDRWILNQIGQIAAEFMALAGQPGYLDVSSLTVLMGPSRERHGDELGKGFYYWTLLEVTWGAE